MRENDQAASAIRYPVALDPTSTPGTAWRNQYWPAKYLIDRHGHVRYVHFGEGDYDGTEKAIRKLLGEPGDAPGRTSGRRRTPDGGHDAGVATSATRRLDRYAGGRSCSATSSTLRVPGEARHRTTSPTPARGASRRSGSSRAAARGCACASRRATSTSSSAARDASRRSSTGKPGDVRAASTADRLYTLRRPARARRAPARAALHARASRRTPSRSGRRVTARGGRRRARSSSRRLLALAQEARQLGRERVARRDVLRLVLELVGAALELLDVGGRLLVGRDRLAHLLDVDSSASSSSLVSIRSPSSSASRSHERPRRARGRRQRDVVRHGGPEARRGDARRAARVVQRRRRSRSGPRSATRWRPRRSTSAGSLALPVTGAGRVCGTSASRAPSVTTSSTPSSRARPTTSSQNVRQRRLGSTPSSRIASRSTPRESSVVEGVLGPLDPARQRPRRARRAAASPGSRRSPPGRSPRTARRSRPSRGSRPRASRPGRRRSSRGTPRSAPGRELRPVRRSAARLAIGVESTRAHRAARAAARPRGRAPRSAAQTPHASVTWISTSHQGSCVPVLDLAHRHLREQQPSSASPPAREPG